MLTWNQLLRVRIRVLGKRCGHDPSTSPFRFAQHTRIPEHGFGQDFRAIDGKRQSSTQFTVPQRLAARVELDHMSGRYGVRDHMELLLQPLVGFKCLDVPGWQTGQHFEFASNQSLQCQQVRVVLDFSNLGDVVFTQPVGFGNLSAVHRVMGPSIVNPKMPRQQPLTVLVSGSTDHYRQPQQRLGADRYSRKPDDEFVGRADREPADEHCQPLVVLRTVGINPIRQHANDRIGRQTRTRLPVGRSRSQSELDLSTQIGWLVLLEVIGLVVRNVLETIDLEKRPSQQFVMAAVGFGRERTPRRRTGQPNDSNRQRLKPTGRGRVDRSNARRTGTPDVIGPVPCRHFSQVCSHVVTTRPGRRQRLLQHPLLHAFQSLLPLDGHRMSRDKILQPVADKEPRLAIVLAGDGRRDQRLGRFTRRLRESCRQSLPKLDITLVGRLARSIGNHRLQVVQVHDRRLPSLLLDLGFRLEQHQPVATVQVAGPELFLLSQSPRRRHTLESQQHLERRAKLRLVHQHVDPTQH